jgi:uncharacterized protein
MMRSSLCLVIVIAALALPGCASSPVTLVALPPPPAPAGAADDKAAPTIFLRSVTLPGYLDAFPIVLGRADGALLISDSTEWAERLSDGVSRVMLDALSRRLGPSRVLMARDGRVPDADLRVEFLSLDPLGMTLNLDARWFFACVTRAESRGGRTHLEVPLARVTPEAVAHATTAALTRFADELAARLPCAAHAAGDVHAPAATGSRKPVGELHEQAH